jgi:hypothetical protein
VGQTERFVYKSKRQTPANLRSRFPNSEGIQSGKVSGQPSGVIFYLFGSADWLAGELPANVLL